MKTYDDVTLNYEIRLVTGAIALFDDLENSEKTLRQLKELNHARTVATTKVDKFFTKTMTVESVWEMFRLDEAVTLPVGKREQLKMPLETAKKQGSMFMFWMYETVNIVTGVDVTDFGPWESNGWIGKLIVDGAGGMTLTRDGVTEELQVSEKLPEEKWMGLWRGYNSSAILQTQFGGNKLRPQSLLDDLESYGLNEFDAPAILTLTEEDRELIDSILAFNLPETKNILFPESETSPEVDNYSSFGRAVLTALMARMMSGDMLRDMVDLSVTTRVAPTSQWVDDYMKQAGYEPNDFPITLLVKGEEYTISETELRSAIGTDEPTEKDTGAVEGWPNRLGWYGVGPMDVRLALGEVLYGRTIAKMGELLYGFLAGKDSDKRAEWYRKDLSAQSHALMGVSDSNVLMGNVYEQSEFIQNRDFAAPVTRELEKNRVSPRKSALRDLLALDYADTREGNRVTDPAAYFYDLMRITLSQVTIGDSANEKDTAHPDGGGAGKGEEHSEAGGSSDVNPQLISIASRRPDLLDIPLDQENASKEIPALALINYVLARQIVRKFLPTPDQDNKGSNASYATLMRRYQKSAFDQMQTKKIESVFHWPFVLEEEQKKSYLNGLGANDYAIAESLRRIQNQTFDEEATEMARRYLGFSPAVADMLKNPSMGDVMDDLYESMGQIYSQGFCQATHMSYTRLVELLRMPVTPNQDYCSVKNPEDYFIYQTSDKGLHPTIRIRLSPNKRDERIYELSEDRVKRIGVFDYLAIQLDWSVDELEHVLAIFQIKGPGISDEQLILLSQIKRLEDSLALSVTTLANILTPTQAGAKGSSLSENYLERIFSQGIYQGTEDKLQLTVTYLELLKTGVSESGQLAEHYKKNDAVESKKNDSEELSRLCFFTDAKSTFLQLCGISGLTAQELVMIVKHVDLSTISKAQVLEKTLHFIYGLGQLKGTFNRSMDEICKLVSLKNNVSEHDEQSAVKSLFDAFSSQSETVTVLFDLHDINERVKKHPFTLDELSYACLGIQNMTQVDHIEEIMNVFQDDPYFRELIESNESSKDVDKEAYRQKISKPSFKRTLQEKLAKLFGVNLSLFNRVIMMLVQKGFLAKGKTANVYLALLLDADKTNIALLDRLLSIPKQYKLKESAVHSARYHRMQAITQSVEISLEAVAQLLDSMPVKKGDETLLLPKVDSIHLPLSSQRAERDAWKEYLKNRFDEFEVKRKSARSCFEVWHERVADLEKSREDGGDIQDLGNKIITCLYEITKGKPEEADENVEVHTQSSNATALFKVQAILADLRKSVDETLEHHQPFIDMAKQQKTQLLAEKMHNIDDVSLFIEILSEQLQDEKAGFVLPFHCLDVMAEYTRAQKECKDPDNRLLLAIMLDAEDKGSQLGKGLRLAKAVGLDLLSWTQLNENIMGVNSNDDSSSEMIHKVKDGDDQFIAQLDQINRLMVLKSLLETCAHDSDLVLAMSKPFDEQNPGAIAQHLASVLTFKDPDAYDRAIRRLAEQERDYLVPAVLRQFRQDIDYAALKITTADRLSEYLLLDVQMSGCDSTTPIVQGHGSLQWYLRRCQTGVESDSYGLKVTTSIPPEWWSWLENYRLWEANRKVYLYPENYLDDGGRTNKSEQFDVVSKALQKPQLDVDLLNNVYLSYLAEMDKMESLRVCGTCEESFKGRENVWKVHLIAVTDMYPKTHYHRIVEKTIDASGKPVFQNWSYWKRIPLHIESDEILVTWDRHRLYLHWIQLHESTKGIQTAECADLTAATLSTDSVFNYQLYCSYQLANETWSPVHMIAKMKEVDKEFSPEGSAHSILLFRDGDLSLIEGRLKEKQINETMDERRARSKVYLILALIKNADTLIKASFPQVELFALFVDDVREQINIQNSVISALHDLGQSEFSDIQLDSPWGQYYWEMMYFIPMLIADKLQTTGQFDRARDWYRTVFNPSRRAEREQTISSFVFAPLVEARGSDIFDSLMNQKDLNDFHVHAFDAHRMARLRGNVPYQKYVVIHFVNNLLAWGDSLFTSATRESVTQAIGYYMAVSDLLGPAPRSLMAATYKSEHYHQTTDDLMRMMLADVFVGQRGGATKPDHAMVIYPYNYLVSSYFKVPENRELMALWTRVEDRLYKIRHCLSIEGLRQKLPLLSPEIDPHQLVRAVAARGGEFVHDMLNQMSGRRRPHYRFMVLIARAKELANFVDRLGEGLMAALEREDASQLVLLQNTYSLQVLDKMTAIKENEIEQAQHQLEALNTRDTAIQQRIDHYQTLLKGGGMIAPERKADVLRETASSLRGVAATASAVAQVGGALPQAGSPFAMTFGGIQLFHAAQATALIANAAAIIPEVLAQNKDRTAFYQRRNTDWTFQRNAAKDEKKELSSQKKAAMLKLAVEKLMLENHQLAIAHEHEVDTYYRDRFTNQDMYHWISAQLYALHEQAYSLAITASSKAAEAYQFELNKPAVFSSTGFWAASRKGLLAGKQLTHALNTMEGAYLDDHGRLPEVEKVISLKDLLTNVKHIEADKGGGGDKGKTTLKGKNSTQDKWKEIIEKLKAGEAIPFKLKKETFDKDFKIDSKQRSIKMINVSVPALAAPNQEINLILTHTTSNEYILISKGESGSGMFTPSFHDSRYLPFEGLALDDSAWTLQLGGTPVSIESENVDDRKRAAMYDSVHDIKIRVFYEMQPKPSSAMTSGIQ